MVWYATVRFNISLDTLSVILETILRVRWPIQHHHSTEGWWLVNQVKGQSHQTQALKGKEKDVSNFLLNIYIAPCRSKTQRCLEDRELNEVTSKPETVDRPVRTARTFVYHYNSTQYCNTVIGFYQYSPSSRPTSLLRCGQVEVRRVYLTCSKSIYALELWYLCHHSLPVIQTCTQPMNRNY